MKSFTATSFHLGVRMPVSIAVDLATVRGSYSKVSRRHASSPLACCTPRRIVSALPPRL